MYVLIIIIKLICFKIVELNYSLRYNISILFEKGVFMKILILFLMALVMVPTFAMGESPPTAIDALRFEGLTLDTLAVSFTQDAAFVLYDFQAIGSFYTSLAFNDKYIMDLQSANANLNKYRYNEFGEPEIVLRL